LKEGFMNIQKTNSCSFNGTWYGTVVTAISNGKPTLGSFRLTTSPKVDKLVASAAEKLAGINTKNVTVPAKDVNSKLSSLLGKSIKGFRGKVLVSNLDVNQKKQIKIQQTGVPEVGDVSFNIFI
jgi:hypothetical protein